MEKQYLKSILIYDENTGGFFWKKARGGERVGNSAGSLRKKDGYIQIKIDGSMFLAHRLAWFYLYGIWPPAEIDHVNGNRADNRIVNLRLASRSENMANYTKPKTNTSGFKGVSFHKASQKWQSYITKDSYRIHLGLFDTPEAAYTVRIEAANKLHGSYMRTN